MNCVNSWPQRLVLPNPGDDKEVSSITTESTTPADEAMIF